MPRPTAAASDPGEPPTTADPRDATRRRLEVTLGVPFTDGNRLELLRNGCEIFPSMIAAIEASRRTIDMVTFVYWKGEIAEQFAELLSRKAREGLRVRVLLDGVGSLPMPSRLSEAMRDAGVDVRIFRPPSTPRLWRIGHRTHRKILICDRSVAFTGGVGIAAEWEGAARGPGEWRDTHVRVEGPVIDGMYAGFIGNWTEAVPRLPHDEDPERPQRSGSVRAMTVRSTAAVDWSDVALLFHVLVDAAHDRLRITTPYFVPDDDSIERLARAVQRGVRVEVLTAGRHNDSRLSQYAGRRWYQRLLDAGVSLRHYERTMMHAKVLTVDGWLACLGSPNFNHRSMHRDDELCLVVDDEAVVTRLDEHFDEDAEAGQPIDPERWKRRSWLSRGLEALAGLVRTEV